MCPICSTFHTDVRKGYSGCKWTLMKKYFEHALQNFDRIQKMGKKKKGSKHKKHTQSLFFFLKIVFFCFFCFVALF